MLDNETKRRIDTARDILVGKVPDPKSQVEQITIALVYKFMDDMDREAVELGGKPSFFTGDYERYGWRKIFDPRIGGHEMLNLYADAIIRMSQNPKLPELFRNIFKNAYLPYRDPETLKLFLKTINEFKYDHSECLGDAFEYLLSVLGSQGDAGQFRTPRHIIDFMVQIVNPQKHETILDPACGTAGFLISSYKHILKENSKKIPGDLLTPEERKKILTNFKGYDISPDMVRLSLVNMYLHGFVQPQIVEYDTLTSEERWNEYADVILANPPFMTPKGGIKPHKKFSVQSNRSEVLFVDYIAEHLTPTGRAAVIVPEGIIFQSANAYKQLRKMLVENYLYAVVSLPAGVFNPYSGVKTSILLMDKQLAKKTDSILFVKIENDGFDLGAQRREIDKNDLPDALNVIKEYITALRNHKPETFNANDKPCGALLVKKEKLAENGEYNLTGERYRVTETRRHQKWPMVKLGEVCTIESGSRQKGGAVSEGIYSIGGEQIAEDSSIRFDKMKYITKEHFSEMKRGVLRTGDILMVKDGATTGKIGYWKYDYEAAVNEHVYIFRANKNTESKFLFRILQSDKFQKLLQPYIKGIIGGVSLEIQKIKIPLPPLEVQREIVAEIEGYQKLIDGCRQVVDAWKPDIQGYLDEELKQYLAEHPEQSEELKDGWKMVKLGEVCEVISGQSPESEYYNDRGEGTPFYQGKTEFTDKYIGAPTTWTTKETKIAEKDDILMSVRAPVGPVNIATQRICIGRGLAAIRVTKKILMPYLFFLLKIKEKDIKGNGGAVFDSISRKDIESIPIPHPPLSVQERIVDKIEAERKVIDGCRELIKTYEEKIKRVIDKVWEG
ncbi:MAG: N-6 DNA methylase [Brevinematia bacterium]